MARLSNSPDYFWFQPLRVLLEECGPYSPQFKFWESLVGGSEGQELVSTDEFCSFGEPVAPDWTIENFLLYGTHEVLVMYAKNRMWHRFCSGGGG